MRFVNPKVTPPWPRRLLPPANVCDIMSLYVARTFILTNTRVWVCLVTRVYDGYDRDRKGACHRVPNPSGRPQTAVSPDDFETASKRQQNTVTEYNVFQAVRRKCTDGSGSTKFIPPTATTGVNKLYYGRTIVKSKRFYFRTVWKRRNI